jgi:N-acetylmuramoyl-L-alanine amidase
MTGWMGSKVVRTAGLLAGLLAARTAVSAAEPVAPPSFPVATEVRLGGDAKQTRIVVDLTRKVDLRAFTLADPYRVVLDLPQVTFQLPPKIGEQGRGLVKAFRYGLVMLGGSRMVFDTSAPVRIEKAYSLDASEQWPARLVIDLAVTDRDSFRAAALQSRQPSAAAQAKQSAPEPPSADTRPVIVIDPGHGGIDTGTRAASGVEEKALVLEFGLLLRDRLERDGRYRVVMTRSDDSYIPLAERVRIARNHKAQLFISIHCDALKRSEGAAQGATVYTLSEQASDAEAARLADTENRADVIAGVDLSAEPDDIADILIDLAQRETKAFSAQFARMVVAEFKAAAHMHKNPIKSAGFRVLKAPDVPSVLLELGYVSSRDDLKQLLSQQWRQRAADALAQSVNSFFAARLASGPARRSN